MAFFISPRQLIKNACLCLMFVQASPFAAAQANTASSKCEPMIDDAVQHIYRHEGALARIAINALPDINCKSSGGQTVLLVVSSLPGFNEATIYDGILARHPDLGITDHYGLTAMYYAAFQGKLDLLDKLIKLTDKKHIGPAASFALLGASAGDQRAAEQRLLAVPDLDVNLADAYGITALFSAAMHSDTTLIEPLLRRGAKANIYETDSGNTPLLWAAQGTPDAVEMLLNSSDVRFKNPFNCESVMHVAVRKENMPVVRLLLSRNIRADETDGYGNTPLGSLRNLRKAEIKNNKIEQSIRNAEIEKLIIEALTSKGMNVREDGTPTANCTDDKLITLANPAGLRLYTPPQTGDLPLGQRPDDFVSLATSVEQRWTAQNHDLLSPSTPGFISYQIFVFAATLCNPQHAPPSRVEQCRRLLHDNLTLQSLIAAALDDAFIRQLDRVPLLSATLAKHIGLDLSRAGLPMDEPNHTSCFSLPPEYKSSTAYWLDAGFPLRIPPDHKLCVVADTYHIAVPTKNLELDIDVDPETTPKAPQIAYRVVNGAPRLVGRRISLPSAIFCPNQRTNDGPLTKPIPGRDDVVIAAPVSFSTAQGVFVAIVDDSGMCKQDCLLGFERAIMQSILLWRSNCSRCERDSALVVRAGDTTYVNSQAVDGLASEGSFHRHSKVSRDRSPQNSSTPFLFAYKQLDPHEQRIRALCQREATELPFLCAPFDNNAAELKLEIRISDKGDACDAADAIACANPAGTILLRALDHRFTMTGIMNSGSHFVFGGTGNAFNLVTVLSHEVGHYFGVPHVKSTPVNGHKADIMRASYAPAGSCMTGSDTSMLNNAVDPRWPFRLSGQRAGRNGDSRVPGLFERQALRPA
jgi:ankyrin repeat protein